MKNRKSYWLLLLGISVMLFLSLGGGIWGAEQSIGHWTGLLFENVCHQNPARSFTVNGTPMAVNTRCFGIFTGLWMGWAAIPLFILFIVKKDWPKWFLLLAVMLQMIDYTGNYYLWENNNISRFLLGSLLGVAVAVFLAEFFHTNKKNRKS